MTPYAAAAYTRICKVINGHERDKGFIITSKLNDHEGPQTIIEGPNNLY